MNVFRIILILLFFLIQSNAFCQEKDSLVVDVDGVAEVTTKRVQRGKTISSLVVSNKIRNKYFDALGMLKEFPFVRYNSINGQISIHGVSQIAYQINGLDKTLEDVKNIPLNAIKRIEICHQIEGKYVVEGIRYVVNFILKEDYAAFDFLVRNFLIVSPAGNNGKNFVASEQPHLNLEFRTNRLDVNVGAGYGRFDWNYPIVVEKEYHDVMLQSEFATPRHPNQYTTRNSFVSHFAVDYKINEKHILSFNASYAPSAYNERTKFLYKDFLNDEFKAIEESDSENKEKDLKFNLNYQGEILKNWSLGVNAGFNQILYDKTYSFFDSGEDSFSAFKQKKRYFYTKISAQYAGFSNCLVDFGAIYTFNNYKTLQSFATTRINSHRYNVFAFATYNFSDFWTMRAGISGIAVNSENEKKFTLQPNLNLNYVSPNEKISLDLEYTMSPSYPKLYQLSDVAYKLDHMITLQGNPKLKPLMNSHQLQGGITLYNFTLQTDLEYNRNSISDFYYQNEHKESFRTYQNARFFNNTTWLTGSFELSSRFSLVAALGFHYNLIDDNNSHRRHKADLLGEIALGYYNEKLSLGASLEYSKFKETLCTLQGQRDDGQDLFRITLQKQWLQGRLRCQFDYVLPIHSGLKTWQREYVDAGFYKMKQSIDLGTYDNMCFIRLSYNFHKGKSTKRISNTGVYDDESKKGRNVIGAE